MTKNNFSVHRENLEVVNERVYDAPLEFVYQTYTNKDLIPLWWGPEELTTSINKMDFKPGGKWKFIQKDTKGKKFTFKGEYKDIIPEEKIVFTFEWEGMPGHVLTETVEFKDIGGKTKVTDTCHYENVEDLDGMVNMGMERGARQSSERFAKLVESNL